MKQNNRKSFLYDLIPGSKEFKTYRDEYYSITIKEFCENYNITPSGAISIFGLKGCGKKKGIKRGRYNTSKIKSIPKEKTYIEPEIIKNDNRYNTEGFEIVTYK